MGKIIRITSASLLFFLISLFLIPAPSYAGAPPGTFICAYVPVLGCRVGGHACESGDFPDPTVCEGLSADECGTTPAQPCTNLPPIDNGPGFTNCAGGAPGIDTAIGCIPILTSQGIASFFLTWGLGIGGGIALILIVYSSYLIMSSAGDPTKLQAGKELLTAAISGVVLMVMAAYMFRVIGLNILQIPGF